MEKYTPMMQQYLETKGEYKDAILFYRLGDFYEMFFEDAKVASRELELVLTGKNCGVEEKAPMCGVPFHSAEGYIAKLIEKGYKVAICEQVEDPKQAKGLVKREVVRTITPGTYIESDKGDSCFIACIIQIGEEYGLSLADVGTGEFLLNLVDSQSQIREILLKYQPSEIVVNEAFCISSADLSFIKGLFKTSIFTLNTVCDDKDRAIDIVNKQFDEIRHDGDFDTQKPTNTLGIISCASLLNYLYETQKNDMSHIRTLFVIRTKGYLMMDAFSFRNLELLEPLRRDDNKGCLFYVMDKTRTAMGKRLLKSYIRSPLIDKDEIDKRLDAVEELNEEMITASEISEYLKGVYDIERLISRISYGTANPRDLLGLKVSIENLPHIKHLLSDMKCDALKEISEGIDALSDIYELIDKAINEDAPISVHDADIIKSGYNSRCDELKSAATDGKSILSRMEEEEREATGIKNLRIRYNKVFGYYIEVTNSYLSLVPSHYIRRQTLANGERFYTEKLKDLEDTILGAKEKLNRIEYELFMEVMGIIRENENRFQISAVNLAKLDVFISMSNIAIKYGYTRPKLNDKGIINIQGGRHPVVERMQYPEAFISNDTYLDNDKNRLYLITGPNMAGKSTYMRQCALIVLMAHMGSFVPAGSADICMVDRIFTRVGASDDLSSGQSTFMVEMNEMANILNNATKDSLIILDEIGRGTATYDGLSIAWAVVEHIANPDKIGAKTLFATHYHELTQLENEISGVKNYSCAVSEQNDSIIFLRKVTNKAADKSYGIQVASLAGVPSEVTDRAKEILSDIVNEHESYKDVRVKEDKPKAEPAEVSGQLSFFGNDMEALNIKESIRDFDINNKTPLDAMIFLEELKKKYKL